jgi:two-component system chemotaxis sensor kinase CheA
VVFRGSDPLRGARAALVRRQLESFGQLVSVDPPLDGTPDQPLGEVVFLVATDAAPADLARSAEACAGMPGEIVAEVSEADGAPGESAGPEEVRPVALPVPPCGQAPAASPGGERASGGAGTLRVDVERLDQVNNLVGELLIERARLAELVRRLASDSVPPELRPVVAGLDQSRLKLESISSALREKVMELRMVPVGTLFARYRRLVRELSARVGKQLLLKTSGEETSIDKVLAEEIADAIAHLVRNCADHGIEPPQVRRRLGKPEAGTVSLTAYSEAGRVVIEVSDDGRGIDLDRVRERAVSAGLVSPDRAGELTPDELVQFIFVPGFSTAEKVSEVSGRGVGMDVVKASVERLRGSVSVRTAPGAGTTFRILLPLSLSTMPALLVEVGGEVLALPAASVRRLFVLGGSCRVYGGCLDTGGTVLPFVDLGRALGWTAGEGARYVLIAEDPAGSFAVGVGSLLGQAEVVLKPVGVAARATRALMGATILGDGRVAPVVDPVALAAELLGGRGR